jgi:hypothetical protein
MLAVLDGDGVEFGGGVLVDGRYDGHGRCGCCPR